jgi:hypothetical protein
MAEYMDNWQPARRVQKLLPEQIAQRKTWARVPDVDLVKAASHVIRVTPGNGVTITEMFELDPGLSGETVGEGVGWLEGPRSYGHCAIHGRCLL